MRCAAARRSECSPPRPPASPVGSAASMTASHTSQWKRPSSALMSLKASSVVASRLHQLVVHRKCCSDELHESVWGLSRRRQGRPGGSANQQCTRAAQ